MVRRYQILLAGACFSSFSGLVYRQCDQAPWVAYGSILVIAGLMVMLVNEFLKKFKALLEDDRFDE